MKKFIVLVLLAVLVAGSLLPGFANANPLAVNVPSGAVGIAENGSLVVAEKGSVVYARKGSNVQHWPGSKLVPLRAQRRSPLATIRASRLAAPTKSCSSETVLRRAPPVISLSSRMKVRLSFTMTMCR